MKNYKTVALAVFAALLIASTSNLMVNEETKPKAGIDLKFIGNNDNQPVFQLNVNNAEVREYIVTFRDEQNTVLYSGKLKGINISKNFQLNTEDGADGSLSVEVVSRKSNKAEVYKINRTTSFTQEIVVNNL
ncbi:MAG: hypothetical protein ABI813_04515 [Bacteroidota bacterium]